jgi:hypothetical protein
LDVLKKMQPEKYPERLPQLFEWCCSDSAPKILEYLLTLLTDLSNLADSGSSTNAAAALRSHWMRNGIAILGTPTLLSSLPG